ncbi:28S ribosomal protein S36: mitochondrial-like isoform X1, partial [Dinothrombium tinctorium]
VVKPHIPLIKFRKGGMSNSQVGMVSVDTSAHHQPTSNPVQSAPIGSTPRGSGIEEEFLPPRYYRKPISLLEMEFIERGGPDTL